MPGGKLWPALNDFYFKWYQNILYENIYKWNLYNGFTLQNYIWQIFTHTHCHKNLNFQSLKGDCFVKIMDVSSLLSQVLHQLQ